MGKEFLDPRSCGELLGDIQHGMIGSLPVSLLYSQLEFFLRTAARTYAPAVGSIPERLRTHNFSDSRSRAVSETLKIDADVVFKYDVRSQKSDLTFKAYFENPGFERPDDQQRVVLHVLIEEPDGVKRSVSVPLQAMMLGWGDVAEGYQGYSHSISFFDDEGQFLEQAYYIGVTSRNWLARMEEHLREMRSGSNKRFHAAWRNYAGDSRVVLGTELIVLNHSFDGIMAWEEEQVDIHMANGSSLNMIPGGLKGLRFLHEHRLTSGTNISLTERDAAIAEFARSGNTRVGIPNLLLANLWRDDEFYLKVLAGRKDVLTPRQVISIRQMAAEGTKEQQICDAVGARNVQQVKRVLARRTYKRVQ